MDSWIRVISASVLTTAMSWCGPFVSASAAQDGHVARLEVGVCDHADAAPGAIVSAELVVADVYRRAGIEIEWTESCASSESLHVDLISMEHALSLSITGDTVGFAAPGGMSATALYDRVAAVARRRHVPFGLLLGYVMAHELGHLLLPAHSHSKSGLMRVDLDVHLAASRRLWFTSAQIELLQSRLDEAARAGGGVRGVVSTN